MIFNTFQDTDIVTGRTTRVASGFWPGGVTNWSQSLFVDDLWDLTGSIATPSPAYGTSLYDVRRTMYYVNVFPNATYHEQHDPYFSATYGHIAGSGSFNIETSSILVNPTKAIYTQYKNMLLGTTDLDGMFTMKTGSTTVSAKDIWVIDFSAYKMKDRIDEGVFQMSFSGSAESSAGGMLTLIDDSPYIGQNLTVYQLIRGTLDAPPGVAAYEGIGLFYPADGVAVLNAPIVAAMLGLDDLKTATEHGYLCDGIAPGTGGPSHEGNGEWIYNSGLENTASYTYNHKTLFMSMQMCTTSSMIVRKSEYVPGRHYFCRVKNREFNYSNNPTYVYDGKDGIHPKGQIYNPDFISDPKTYITTVGLYNDNNELVAVAKLSRPAVKSFDQELLLKIKLDF